ncbi:MAG: hypothetical protein AB8B91_22555 [Rubripirellula sp.]
MRYAFPLLAVAFCSASFAADWLTLPSTYTHDAASGVRMSQHTPITGPAAPTVSNFRTSGYTHTRSSLNYGASADNYHRVERWGDPIRPYGEWRFPYRPYSTPYPNWGAPLAGLNAGGFGFGGGYRPGLPRGGYIGRPLIPGSPAGGANPLQPYPAGPGTPYPVAPYYDGYHPNYRD